MGPGLPLWLPNGTIIIEELERLAKEVAVQLVTAALEIVAAVAAVLVALA